MKKTIARKLMVFQHVNVLMVPSLLVLTAKKNAQTIQNALGENVLRNVIVKKIVFVTEKQTQKNLSVFARMGVNILIVLIVTVIQKKRCASLKKTLINEFARVPLKTHVQNAKIVAAKESVEL